MTVSEQDYLNDLRANLAKKIDSENIASRQSGLSEEGREGFLLAVMREGYTRPQAESVAKMYASGSAGEIEKAIALLKKQEKSDSNPFA